MTSSSVNYCQTSSCTLPETPEEVTRTDSKIIFGFWIYVMTDAIMFATLFAVYAVLHHNTYGGPGIQQVATLHHMLIQTLIIIISAFTLGLSTAAFYRGHRTQVLVWLLVSFLLGLAFLNIEFHDLSNLVAHGYNWTQSAFLSSYFALIGIHAVHIIFALLWMVVLFLQVTGKGLTQMMQTRFTCLGLFWNFLNLIWILTFVIVFLMGAL